MNAPGPGIAMPALYEEVAERLRQRIFAHELAPGTWIDEQSVAEGLGISRTPLREALKVLAAEGLVTLKPRRGCYVTEITERDLDEIFPILSLLEGRCAREAAEKASPEDVRKLGSLHDRLEQACRARDVEAFFEANQAFHSELQRLAGNRWLEQMIAELRQVLKLTRHHSLLAKGRLQASLAEHRAIMRAIRTGDADRAEARMREHLIQGRKALASVSAGPAPE